MKRIKIIASIISAAILAGILVNGSAEANTAQTSSKKWTDLPGVYTAAKICDGRNLIYVSYNSIAVAQNDRQCGGDK